jgi:ribosomal protein S18 acetylase RimI-like enzyme
MKTRWLDKDDLVAWREHRSEALKLFPEAFLTTLAEFQVQSDETVRGMLAHRKMLGMFDADRLIAAGALLQLNKEQTKHRAEIGAFYVVQDRHGTGTADALMQALIAHATEREISQLELFVWDGNPRAIRFYQRHGFEKMGRLPAAVLIDGEARDDLFMVKTL